MAEAPVGHATVEIVPDLTKVIAALRALTSAFDIVATDASNAADELEELSAGE